MDVSQVKIAGQGRELEILEYCAHLPRSVLDGKHHPCPACGGKDRLRYDAKKKFVFCNGCFSKKNGDIIAAVQHFRGIDFPTALAEVAYRLALTDTPIPPKNGQPRPIPVAQTTTTDDHDPADPLTRLAITKRCPVSGLLTYGAESDTAMNSVAFPMFNASGQMCSVFTIWPDVADERLRKGICKKDHPTGLFLPNPGDDPPMMPSAGERWIVCEGVKDAAVLHSMGFLVAGLCGAHLKDDLAPIFRGVDVVVLLDNDAPGREAAPKIAAQLRSIASGVRIATLPHPGDVRDNLHQDDGEAGIRQAIASAGQSQRTIPAARTVRELVADFPRLRDPSIHGLLRVGETCNLISAPKVGKSWLACDLALHKATGRPWLNTFDVEPGMVLVLDNELHQETSAHRLPKVAERRGIPFGEYADKIRIVNLRGCLCDVNAFGQIFDEFTADELNGALVIVDAFYRSLPIGTSENDNSGIAAVYNLVDSYAMNHGMCFVMIHHSSKGNQAAKSVTDVGSGAGSQSRATDTHLILRQHSEPGHYVMEAAVRSWKPLEPVVLRWDWPCWEVADGMDPAALKSDRPTATDRREEVKSRILKAMVHFPDGGTRTAIQKYTGRPNCWMDAVLELLESGDLIECEVSNSTHSKTDQGYKRVYTNDDDF